MPTDKNAGQIPYDFSLAAVAKTSDAGRVEGAQKLKEYLSDPDRREKVARILTNLGKFAGDSAVNESLIYKVVSAVAKTSDAGRVEGAQKLKEYLSDPDRREKVARILTNLGKFAVDSAIKESLIYKVVPGGMQVYKIVQEGLKDQSPLQSSSNGKKKPELTLAMEEIQAKIEKMQEALNEVKAKDKTAAAAHTKGSDPMKKISEEPVKGSDPPQTDKRRVMIRSRL